MITAIECACMHSGLTEQQVKEKYGWVLQALNEYGSRCVSDFTASHSQPSPEGREVTKANAAQVLTGFLFNDKNKFPLSAVKGSIQKGFDIDLQDQLSFLMNFQSWLFDNYLRRTTVQDKGYSREDIIQDFKELSISLDGLCLQTEKDAGHSWIAFTDKFNAFKERILATLPSQSEQNDNNPPAG